MRTASFSVKVCHQHTTWSPCLPCGSQSVCLSFVTKNKCNWHSHSCIFYLLFSFLFFFFVNGRCWLKKCDVFSLLGWLEWRWDFFQNLPISCTCLGTLFKKWILPRPCFLQTSTGWHQPLVQNCIRLILHWYHAPSPVLPKRNLILCKEMFWPLELAMIYMSKVVAS